MPAEMMYPALGRELAHERIDEGEPCLSVLPPLEPALCDRRVDGVSVRHGQAAGRVDGVAQVPGNKAAVSVCLGLVKDRADAALRAEIHVAEEQLACQAGGRLARLALVVVDDVLRAPVDLATAEGAKVEVRG